MLGLRRSQVAETWFIVTHYRTVLPLVDEVRICNDLTASLVLLLLPTGRMLAYFDFLNMHCVG